jgi:hypothetical protein
MEQQTLIYWLIGLSLIVVIFLTNSVIAIFRRKRILEACQLATPKDFFKLMKFEIDSLSTIKSHIELNNSSISKVYIPSVDNIIADIHEEDAYIMIQTQLSKYFEHENLQRGINSMSLNNIPYYSRMHKKHGVIAMAKYIGKEIPEINSLVIAIANSCKDEESAHKRFYKFWTLLCKNIEKKDKAIQVKFDSFCQKCLSIIYRLHSPKNDYESEYHRPSQSGNSSFNYTDTYSFSHSDLIDIGLMTGLSYFVLDLDDIDVVSDSVLDEFLSGEVLSALENTLDFVATSGIPVISIARENKKQKMLRNEGLATVEESWKYGTISVVSKAAGAIAGGKVGAVIGTIIIPLPGLGTLIGGLAGSIIGAITGTKASHKWKVLKWEEALDLYKKMRGELIANLNRSYRGLAKKVKSIISKKANKLDAFKNAALIKSVNYRLEYQAEKSLMVAIENDYHTLNRFREKMEHEKGNEIKSRLEQVKKVIGYYRQIKNRDLFGNSKKFDLQNIYSDIPVLKGGNVDKFLNNEYKSINSYNSSIGIGFLLLYFNVVKYYDKCLSEAVKTTIEIRDHIDSEFKKSKGGVDQQLKKVNRLRAQIEG